MNATSTMVGKPVSYEVNASNDRSFSSARKSEVMAVAKAYRRQGLSPVVYAIGDDAEGRVTCDQIAIA